MRFIALAAASAALLSSCSGPCTLVGCAADGLTVEVKGISEGTTSLRVRGDIDGEAVDVTCASTGPFNEVQGCGQFGEFRFPSKREATRATLTVEEGGTGRKWSGELQPKYVRSFPNGEECDPGCSTARETVTLAAP